MHVGTQKIQNKYLLAAHDITNVFFVRISRVKRI